METEAVADTVHVTCGDSTLVIRRGGAFPNEPVLPEGTTATNDGARCDFDTFSWNTFLALNTGGGGAVWDDWPESSSIFLADGAPIPAWQEGAPPPEPEPAPDVCDASEALTLQQLAKHPNLLEESDEPFRSGPLIDVQGNYARFAIFVNWDMYDYIQANALYNRDSLQTFVSAETVNFPCGCDVSRGDRCTPDGVEGAVMIKTAWRLLTDQDDASRYYTIRAHVYTPPVGDDPASCRTQTVGLVGLHIGHKTQTLPQWVWSTFEHVDNAPTEGEVDPSRSYSFYRHDRADCDGCTNAPPPQPWNPHNAPVPPDRQSQVVREVPISPVTQRLNAAVRPLLAGSVWANYELVGTQWPTQASDSGQSGFVPSAASNWCMPLNRRRQDGVPQPTVLANTTLETYIQGTDPQTSSSCLNCHLNATIAGPREGGTTRNLFSDFTYLLERAQ